MRACVYVSVCVHARACVPQRCAPHTPARTCAAQAEGRDLAARAADDLAAAAKQRAALEDLSRELVAEQQQLVRVATECQVGSYQSEA